jgi:hypothetical protein
MAPTRFLVGAALAAALSSCGSASTTAVQVVSTQANTTTPADSSVKNSDDAAVGDLFTDPQGTYTMTISRDWTDASGTAIKEVEAWLIAPPSNGFAPNVNVLTQVRRGTDLDKYMDENVRAIGVMGWKVLRHSKVAGANGYQLGLMEFSGAMNGQEDDRVLHFLAIFDVRDDQVVLATLTAEEDSFEQQRQTAEPFMLTLQAT